MSLRVAQPGALRLERASRALTTASSDAGEQQEEQREDEVSGPDGFRARKAEPVGQVTGAADQSGYVAGDGCHRAAGPSAVGDKDGEASGCPEDQRGAHRRRAEKDDGEVAGSPGPRLAANASALDGDAHAVAGSVMARSVKTSGFSVSVTMCLTTWTLPLTSQTATPGGKVGMISMAQRGSPRTRAVARASSAFCM